MGCDIHILVEGRDKWFGSDDAEGVTAEEDAARRLSGWGPWRVLATHDACCSKRNYAVFAAFANVRNREREIEPISEPRGLPEDATAEARAFLPVEGGNLHSHSWLLLGEAAKAIERAQTAYGGDTAATWKRWLDVLAEVAAYKVGEVRLVFAFDN